jgi:cell division protein FtsB
VGGDKMIRRFSNMTGKMSGKKLGIILFVLFGVGILGRSVLKYADMKSQRDSIKSEIEQLKEDNVKLQEKITNLYNDREYVEKVSREQLNLVKDGETVYIISRD